MDLARDPILQNQRASLADAKLAYFEGDFERCLEICTNIRVRTLSTASEVALLTARAYLRTGRAREAQDAIVGSLETHATLDASLTAEMLLATARIRQDDADTGIGMLADAASRSAGAHFAIRSEIAFCTALGYWSKREIEAAESFLAQVDPRSDIIHARALELQAWCHTARCDYRRSAEYFRLTLVRLDDCAASDRAITATAISTLAIFAAELFDRDIARFVEARMERMEWSPGVKLLHYFTVLHQALFHEFAGDTVEAYQRMTQACELAPTVAFEVVGWASSSAIARNAGEAYSAIVYAKRAQRLLGTIDPGKLTGDERFAMLTVVENSARFDIDAAGSLFTSYLGPAPIDKMPALLGDPRLAAEETFVAGILAQARGESDSAREKFHKAFDTFRAVGYVRRAIHSALALLELDGDTAELRAYIDVQLAGTHNYVTKSLASPDDDRMATLAGHRIVASLPPTQREVVAQICLGKTNKEIALLRNVGEQTIKNMLTKSVFPAFGVSSRAGLVSRCLRGS